ncbi:DUF305 domain-containing protein [Agrobacterium sp. CNPSo 2736]|uniref:DUF305 domain-containing protein n=1 Tax=Agrobacterium deltaense Zutra 3/1 TaxID=1183427 RepID=A0A1S7RBP1_9HYPH|nr:MULTISPECIES: DUF305 domain-containing protein [Agrobacterium]RVT76331.1 DUF305 domain-containing protein [Agrobacterium sp. CNPSo 2736]CUX50116.1 conserved membrane hypothetical protein [Agrobacterium deltaense Zutra 3/1]
MDDNHGTPRQRKAHTASHSYAAFALNMVLSLVVMYLVMFSMIDGWGDFRHNLNMVYMALTMVAPMGILMLATMGGMYPNKRLNLFLHAGLALLFVAAFTGTRSQTLIGDRQFIASMVPHHSGAILMCRKAVITDLELMALCSEISRGQRIEIERMNAIDERLSARVGGAQR